MTTGAAAIDTLPVRLRRALLIAAGIYLALLPTGWATAARSIAFGACAALALLILALSRSGRGESIPSPGPRIGLERSSSEAKPAAGSSSRCWRRTSTSCRRPME